MNYRLTEVWPQKSYSADQTEIIDINVKDPISMILVDFDTYNSTETEPDGHPAQSISKIELVDGSDVLYSLTGQEAQALDFYDRGFLRQAWFHYMSNNYTDMAVAINFGRYLWDEELALDPNKFSNLQLKITVDIGGGGSTSTAVRLRVLAAVFDQKEVSPIGFLQSKEIRSYTLEDSGHEYIDLPTDHELRALFVRAQRLGTECNQQLESIKLSEDNDKRVPFDLKIARFMRSLISQTPPVREGILIKNTTSAVNFLCTPTTTVYGSITTWMTAAGAGEHAFYNGDGGQFAAICATADKYAHVMLQGYCPHGVFHFPMGKPGVIEDWYDVREVGSLVADIEGASSVGTSKTCELILQQLRRYAG